MSLFAASSQLVSTAHDCGILFVCQGALALGQGKGHPVQSVAVSWRSNPSGTPYP